MVQSSAKTVAQYIEELPADRRKEIETVRRVIRKNLPKGYEECMMYGMIGYAVPLSVYPQGYLNRKNEPLGYVALASQKNYLSLYVMNIYSDKETLAWFNKEWKKSGKKLDMGKSCIRFKRAEDLPLDLIGKVIALTPMKEWIKIAEKLMSMKRKK